MNTQAILGHTHSRRVAFVGPFGVGKTTALRAISDIPVVDTDVASSERLPPIPGKTHTTVGFDYGELKLPDGERIGLFGLPGQDRFGAMWHMVLPSASAVVLWLHGDHPQLARELRHWLAALNGLVTPAKLSVAVTRVPPELAESRLELLSDELARFNPVAPLLTADPRRSQDVRLAVAMALAAVTVPHS